MGDLVYSSYKIERKPGKFKPPGEWVLFLSELDTADHPYSKEKYIFKYGCGLMVRFWIGDGCLGTKHWDYEIIGNPNHRSIDLFFLKQSGNYVFINILDEFLRNNINDQSIEAFDKFMENKFISFKKIDKKLRKWDIEFFSQGVFGEVTVCG